MSTARSFSLSTNRLDFGAVAPHAQPTKTLMLKNHSGGNFQFQVMADQAWLDIQFGQQQGDDMPLRVTLDPTKFSGRGKQTANLQVQALGTTQSVKVSAVLMGTPSSGRPAGSASASSSPAPTSAPTPVPSAGRSSGHTTGKPSVSFSLSLPLTVAFLSLLFGSLHSIALGAFENTEGGQEQAAMVVACAGLVYFALAFAKLVLAKGIVLDPKTTEPQQRQLLDALARVCQRAGVKMPRVVLRNDPTPNVCCWGFSPSWCSLHVNQGLLQAIGDPDELQAPLAHEIAHLKRFDTFFFTCLNPPLWIIHRLLGFVQSVLMGAGKGGRRMNFAPMMLPMMFLGRGMGMVGCFVALMVIFALAFMLMFLLTYALVAIAGLLAFSIASLMYSRAVEKRADLEAARIVGDSDLVLAALARSGDYWPAERNLLDQYASLHLGSASGYTLVDIVRNLEAGGDPVAGIDFRQRLFRSHPLLTERIASVVRVHGSRMAY